MALSRTNEFDTGSTLTETKLEGEFDAIYNNALSLISPLTGALDTGATGQIVFPATQTASAGVNTLDDYEEGTWTPVLTFATPGNLSVVYTTQLGIYRKIGALVFANFNIVTSTFTHTTASGACNITGLPFACLTSAGLGVMGPLYWQGITKASFTDVNARVTSGLSLLDLVIAGSGQTAVQVATGDMPTAGSVVLTGSIVYPSAS